MAGASLLLRPSQALALLILVTLASASSPRPSPRDPMPRWGSVDMSRTASRKAGPLGTPTPSLLLQLLNTTDIWHSGMRQVARVGTMLRSARFAQRLNDAMGPIRVLLSGYAESSPDPGISKAAALLAEDGALAWGTYADGFGEEAFDATDSAQEQSRAREEGAFSLHAPLTALARRVGSHLSSLHRAWPQVWSRASEGHGAPRKFQVALERPASTVIGKGYGAADDKTQHLIHPLSHIPEDIWQTFAEELTV